jgi:hypothetical protein
MASATPRWALDVVKPWEETLDAMLFADKLLSKPRRCFRLDHLVLLLFFLLICWTRVASAVSRCICTPLLCIPLQHPPDGVLHPWCLAQQQGSRVLQHHAYRHFVEHLSCVLDTAIVFLHLAKQLSTTTPPARAVARHVALQHRLLALMGPICSGRPTLAHTASFRASSRARSRHPFGIVQVRSGTARKPL